MRYRKNKKRIDPRYFLDETIERGDEEDIARLSSLTEIDTKDVPEWGAEQAALAPGIAAGAKNLAGRLAPSALRALNVGRRLSTLGGAASEFAGNVAVPGMAQSGLIPGAPESWKKSALEQWTDPADERATAERVADTLLGTQQAGGLDWGDLYDRAREWVRFIDTPWDGKAAVPGSGGGYITPGGSTGAAARASAAIAAAALSAVGEATPNLQNPGWVSQVASEFGPAAHQDREREFAARQKKRFATQDLKEIIQEEIDLLFEGTIPFAVVLKMAPNLSRGYAVILGKRFENTPDGRAALKRALQDGSWRGLIK